MSDPMRSAGPVGPGLPSWKATAVLIALVWICLICPSPGDAAEWREVRGDHFVVSYPDPGGRAFAEETLQRAEEYYDRINADLGFDHATKSENLALWRWDDRCRIRLHRDRQAYVAETGAPAWSAGFVNPRERVLHSYGGSAVFLASVLPHELAHIFLRELVGFDNPTVPTWVSEGVAQYAEDGRRRESVERMRGMLAHRVYLPFQQFNPMTTRPLTPDQAGLFYAQAASVVHFFIERYGSKRFVELLKGLRDGQPIERALSFATGSRIDSLHRLEEKWLEFYAEGARE
ncbi:MAG: peptidase MA family metallohydrolase [Deferrisomatales bacterium]|nr:peptidase MA family metallohydrolase [Deferrisomatales bacterium]